MGDFVYTGVPGKLKLLLGKIRTVGVPSKVTVQWLKTIGFTSSNDSTLIGVLRFIGLIDSSNVPTPKWTQYRGSNHKSVLSEAIRDGYSELFAVYPDAEKRTQTDLDHVFSIVQPAESKLSLRRLRPLRHSRMRRSFPKKGRQTFGPLLARYTPQWLGG